MKSIADQLPPEIARQIHPDRRKNEAEYWAVRDQLLDQYRGQWIGFAEGRVVASGTSPVTVFHAAEATGLHPFFICVGREEEPCRIRRVAFAYDAGYPGEALPLIAVEFRQASGASGRRPGSSHSRYGGGCKRLALSGLSTPSVESEPGRARLDQRSCRQFRGNARFSECGLSLDGQDYPCRLQADFVGGERILGRDVLNRLEVLFRGPACEAVINP